MVRLSDIIRKAPPLQERRDTASPSPVVRLMELPKAPEGLRLSVLQSAQDFSASETLYQNLLAASQQCLDRAAHDERMELGALPELMEQAVERLARGEEALFRFATRGEAGFSLPGHGVNVAILTIRVGLAQDIRRSVLVDLGLAGLLQDIGMVKFRHLLHAPTQFGPDQRTQMHEHPILGRQLAQGCPSLTRFMREIIAQEHERVDGSGYPEGLTGERLSDEAQLVGLLDCYEALIHDRPHRKRLVSSEAIRSIVQHQRQAFHPQILRAFLDTIPVYPIDSWVRLTSGESAKVAAFTPRTRLAPIVDILVNPQGQPVGYPQTVDLSKHSGLAIARAIPEPVPQS